MKVIRHRKFEKSYLSLSKKDQERIDVTLRKFIKDPKNSDLKNHALKGSIKGKRAISAGFDLRIIFETHKDYLIVIMLDVGKHDAVYP